MTQNLYAQSFKNIKISQDSLLREKYENLAKSIKNNDYKTIENHIKKANFNINLLEIHKNWDKDNLVSHLYKDKKTQNGKLTFILPEKIGSAFVKKGVDVAEFLKVVDDFI